MWTVRAIRLRGMCMSPGTMAVMPGCTAGLPRKYCFGDALFSRSVDGGATWSAAPIRVNDDPVTSKADHLFPAVAVDEDGQLAVVFYDRRRDGRNFLIDTFVATSD